ncbi:MAG: hypothetical protein Q8932_05605 [Bacteroidota bacterium]|nr:hypothetical protein [Bacteroidota bacterium]
MKKYLPLIKVAALTSLAILLFQWINILVVFRFVRIDLYAAIIALSFLGLGWFIGRPQLAVHPVPSQNKALGPWTAPCTWVFLRPGSGLIPDC